MNNVYIILMSEKRVVWLQLFKKVICNFSIQFLNVVHVLQYEDFFRVT